MPFRIVLVASSWLLCAYCYEKESASGFGFRATERATPRLEKRTLGTLSIGPFSRPAVSSKSRKSSSQSKPTQQLPLEPPADKQTKLESSQSSPKRTTVTEKPFDKLYEDGDNDFYSTSNVEYLPKLDMAFVLSHFLKPSPLSQTILALRQFLEPLLGQNTCNLDLCYSRVFHLFYT